MSEQQKGILIVASPEQVEAGERLYGAHYEVFLRGDEPDTDSRDVVGWQNGESWLTWAEELATARGKAVILVSGRRQISDFPDIHAAGEYTKKHKQTIEPMSSGAAIAPAQSSPAPVSQPEESESEAQAVVDATESEFSGVPSSLPQGASSADSPPVASDPDMPPAFDGPIESYAPPQEYGFFYGKRDQPDEHPDWPEPLDITKTVHFAKPFPIAFAPTALQPFLASVAERKGVSTCIPFLGALAAICGLAKDGIQLQVKLNDTGWRESARGWFVVIGDSSSGKTPGLLGPLSPVQRMADREHERNYARMQDWKFKQDQYDVAYKKAVATPGAERPMAPEKPGLRHLLINKFNEEGLRDVLVEEENGILVYRDEVSGTVGELDRYASKSDAGGREDMLEGYNGGPRVIGRAGKQIRIKNWSFSLVGGITPDAIKKYAGKLEKDGFLQRMFMGVARAKVSDVDEAMPENIGNGYKALLQTVFEMGPALVTMEPRAYDIFQSFMSSVRSLIKYEENAALAAHLGKWEGLAPRMMLAYLIVEKAAFGQHLQPHDKVTAAIAQQVCDLFMHWELSQLEEFWNSIMGSKSDKAFAVTMARYILAHDELTELSHSKDIYKQHWRTVEKMPHWEIRNALNLLWDAGWIVPKGAKRNGQGLPSFWLINPRIGSYFAEERAEEKQARSIKRAELLEQYAAAEARESAQG